MVISTKRGQIVVSSLTLTAVIAIISGGAWLIGNVYSRIDDVSAQTSVNSVNVSAIIQSQKDSAQELQDIKKEIDAIYQTRFGQQNDNRT